MWQFIRSPILAVIIFIGTAHGILVVGPKFIRPNQNYTVVVSNFLAPRSNANVTLRMKGYTVDGRNVLNLTKSTDVGRHLNKVVNFNMPKDLPAGKYKITIDGQGDFNFYMDENLVYLSKTVYGLIQIDRTVFKLGDTVKLRVIVLDTELKPPVGVQSIHVVVRDSQNNTIREWSSAKLQTGVFENNLQIAPTSMLGVWNISVLVDGEDLVSKTFEVNESMLSSFNVELIPPAIPLEEHQGLNLTIAANYHVRKPVKGLAKIELYLDNYKLDQMKEFEVYGMKQMELQFVEPFKMHEDQKDVLVKTTFTEQSTNHTVVKESQITVYKYPYRVQLIKESPPFRPGLPFKCALQFRYHDGTPAKGITGKIAIIDIDFETTATSDHDGLIKLELIPIDSPNPLSYMYITFTNDDDGFYFYERVEKEYVKTNSYIKLELKSPIKLNRLMQFMVTSNEAMTSFVYYVVSKGNIIDSGIIRPNSQMKYPFRLMASKEMIPKAKIIVVSETTTTLVYDFVDIDFKDLRNNFDLSIVKQKAQPETQIELRMSTHAGAYVGLAASNKNHDLFWEDLMRMYNGFGSYDEKEFDKFHNMGLFVSTLGGIKFNEAHDMATRYESQINNPITKQESNSTNIPESWLWKNVTIGRSGTHTMIEAVPDTSASWYLTGFSIDPEYGLGIIKNPIEFTTILPFYIVENLPYSIKRGEVVELQFTLFNNLGEEYNAEVTLYNVFNQIELIGRSLEDESYTKSVSVPPKIGVPISFLVRARSLGEITVRVKARILGGQVTDALEKLLRVMPESLVQKKKDSWFFRLDTCNNQTFLKVLDKIPNADNGSLKLEFQLNPNLLTTVIEDLDELVAESGGDGERNMVKFSRNLMVLDYMHAIGSVDNVLIDEATHESGEGYRFQIRFRRWDGSFAVWQEKDIGSMFLTAFVVKSLHTAPKYINGVEEAVIEHAYDWLATKQNSSGRFDEVGSVLNKRMKGGLRDGITLTSFVVTAFLENEKAKVIHAEVIQKAMSYLSSQVDSLHDPYELSIVTYALMLSGHSMKDTAFNKLLNMSKFMHDGRHQYWDSDYSIETTAYALLSFVIAERYVDAIPVMDWLVNQRHTTASFEYTQDTFVGLMALTKLAEKISSSRNEYDLNLKVKNLTQHSHINSEYNYRIYDRKLPPDTESLEINIVGTGVGLMEVIYEYSLSLVHFEQRFKLDLEQQINNSSDELRQKLCVSFIPTALNSACEVAMIEVNLPNGYAVDQNPISEQTTFNPIQKTDIRYGGTTVVVYYRNMGIERNCFTVTAYKRAEVTLKRPAYVVVYDHFKPQLNAIKMYEVDEEDNPTNSNETSSVGPAE
uniref:TEP1-F n=1 Tax=Anopheles funestus TaxID=62324 RepID=A0A4Y0BEZ7_ANOFN